MEIKLQLALLGLAQLGKITFDKRKQQLINNSAKRVQKPLLVNKRYIYRLTLGFSERYDFKAKDVHYIFNFGVFDPTGEVINKDGDRANNHKDNLMLKLKGNRIPNDVKHKIYALWGKGLWYAEIGRRVNVNKLTVKKIIEAEFGEIMPRQSQQNRKFYQSMQKDISRSSLNLTKI